MMKHLVISLIALCCCISISGQHITRSYNNVPMPEVLRDLNQQSRDYNISFLYNELEDFRVTTDIKRKSLPEAISRSLDSIPSALSIVENMNSMWSAPIRPTATSQAPSSTSKGSPWPMPTWP